jgi:dimethylargininase
MKVYALFRYQTLTVPEEDAANCLFVNGTLIHISSTQASESVQVYQNS